VDIAINAKAGHRYLLTSTHDYEKSRWHVVVRDETAGRSILKEGPYPLNKVRTGDNRLQSTFFERRINKAVRVLSHRADQ
jgi:hypothetical protein